MAKNKVLAKAAQFYTGTDLMGSQLTVNQKNSEIEVTPVGLKVKSKKNKRIVLIPWSNVKGAELFPDSSEDQSE